MAWASRVVLAVLFAFGMLGSATRPILERGAEKEPIVEIGEDGETVAREEELLRSFRRPASHGPRWARRLAGTRPPAKLDPTVAAPARPDWQRPRRAPPPGDDDLAIG